jgi:hypothetical protein
MKMKIYYLSDLFEFVKHMEEQFKMKMINDE